MGSSSACPRRRSCSRSSGARSCPARSSPPSSPPRWIDGAATGEHDRRSASSRATPVSVLEHPADLDALLVLDRRRRPPRRSRRASRRRRRAPARRAHAARDRRPATCPTGELIADVAAAERRPPRRHRAHQRACSSGIALARDRARDRVREGARAVRPGDRLVPGGQAPLRRHARAGRGRARGGVRSRGARSTAAATTIRCAPRRRRRSWPATPPSPTARRASRCTAGSGSRGRSTRSASGSAPCVLDTHFGNSDEHAEAVAAML